MVDLTTLTFTFSAISTDAILSSSILAIVPNKPPAVTTLSPLDKAATIDL